MNVEMSGPTRRALTQGSKESQDQVPQVGRNEWPDEKGIDTVEVQATIKNRIM